MVLNVGQYAEFPFELFEQEPACNYPAKYTASTYLKPDAASAQLPYVKALDGIVEGKPKLVTVDLESRVIKIDAKDDSLGDKKFQVFIACHLDVNKTVQEEFFDYLPPFDVSVKLDKFKPQNMGPEMIDFNELVELQPASSQLVTIGKMFDVEGDQVTLTKFIIKDANGKVEQVPWILFNNKTKSNMIDF